MEKTPKAVFEQEQGMIFITVQTFNLSSFILINQVFQITYSMAMEQVL